MSKKLVIYFSITLVFILLVSLWRRWLNINFYPFWIGAFIGVFLPDLDYFITSNMIKEGFNLKESLKGKDRFLEAWKIQSEGRRENPNLILHTSFFQTLFLVLTFLMITSSGSVFGMGLTLSFSLHLLVDQIQDYLSSGTISNWFSRMDFRLSQIQEKGYLGFIAISILLLGLVF